MKHTYKIVVGLLLLILTANARAQQNATDAAPGIKLNSNGTLQIGDIFAEIGHFDGSWTISQQHDAFKPSDQTPPATQPSSHIITGVFTSAAGPFNLKEQVDSADGGIHYSAAAS